MAQQIASESLVWIRKVPSKTGSYWLKRFNHSPIVVHVEVKAKSVLVDGWQFAFSGSRSELKAEYYLWSDLLEPPNRR